MTSYRIVTFSAHAALFDLESSLIPALTKALGPASSHVDLQQVLKTWRDKQLEYALISNSLQQGQTPFPHLTRRTLDYTLQRFQMDVDASIRSDLVNAWKELTPWPEVQEVLTEIKAQGYAIGLLSNSDENTLQLLSGNFSASFDYLFAANQAGFYKPHPKIYHLPLVILKLTAHEVLHVTGSATDTFGAKAAGLACAWVNREEDVVLDAAYAPDFEIADLTGLLEIL
ncbi:MAG: haloacid dehalogenase type II [Chloroflexota bacterium]